MNQQQYRQYADYLQDRVCALALEVSEREADIAYLRRERAVMATLLDEWVPNWKQRVDAQMPGHLKSWKEDSKGRL